MKETIDVQTGEVRAGRGKVILHCAALGSCVAVILVDAPNQRAAMAHVMLPGRAPPKTPDDERTKYAADAIRAALVMMNDRGAQTYNCRAAIAGGANVLQRPDDNTAVANVESCLAILRQNNFCVVGRAVGGFKPRSASVDAETGVITYCELGDRERVLWRPE